MNTLLNTDMIGNTKMLQYARAKVMKKLNKGKKGESALVAAREAYKKVIAKDQSSIRLFTDNNVVFKYLDFDNEVKIFIP